MRVSSKGSACSRIVFLFGLLFFVGLITSSAFAGSVPYFAREAAQEAIVSEMTIQPASVRVGEVTYLAYQGLGFDPYVSSYDSSDGSWRGPTRIGVNPLRLDAHGAPALYRDPQGRVHAFYGAHWTPLLHARQSESGADSSWQAMPPLPTGTYPQPVALGGSDLLFFYRGAGGTWSCLESHDGATTFGPPVSVLSAEAGIFWYADFRADAAGTVRAVFTWVDQELHDEGLEFVRRNVYYAERAADGTWRDAMGDTLALPITKEIADARCRIVDSGDLFVNEVSVKTDSSGAPCVLYLIGSGSGPGAYEWRFMRRATDTWSSSTITDTDHFFDAAAFDPRPSGVIEAFVVTGASDARGSVDGDYRGRGGAIERWVSEDSGSSWQFGEEVSPGEPGILYSDPVLVPEADSNARLVFTDWSDDESRFFHRLFLWGDSGLIERETPAVIERLAGPNRAATAIEVSKRAFPEGARTVVIATQDDYPDALAGAPLAGTVNGPILLTSPDYLRSDVAAEIRRLGVRSAIVLGGTAAVSDAVISAIKDETDVSTVERVGGRDRFVTGLLISRRMRDTSREIDTALVVSGWNWPDAVAAAPLASANSWPIVLADGNRLPGTSENILAEYGISRTLIVGGTEAVGPALDDALPGAYRVGGLDRYETAALLAAYSLDEGLLPGRGIVATGRNFPDALSAGVLGGRARAPVLLVRTGDIPASVRSYVTAHAESITDLWLIGEEDVVSADVEEQFATVLSAR